MTSRRIHAHTEPKQYHWIKETSHWYCRKQFHVHISHVAPSFDTNISCDFTGLATSPLYRKADRLYSLTQCACMVVYECAYGLYQLGLFLYDILGWFSNIQSQSYIHTYTECINLHNTASQIKLQTNYRQWKMHLIIMDLAIIY